MTGKKLLLVSLAVLAGAALIVGFTATAYAQSSSDDGPGWPGPWGPGKRGAGILSDYIDQDALEAELAGALGLSATELEQAREDGVTLYALAQQQDVDLADLREIQAAYRLDAIEKAVESGAISSEMAERLEADPRPGLGRFPHGAVRGILSEYLDESALHAALADALGISTEEFEQARSEGVTLSELADQQDVDLMALREIQQDYIQEAIEQAVESGAIDEEMAERLEEAPMHGIGGTGLGPGARFGCLDDGQGPQSGMAPDGNRRR